MRAALELDHRGRLLAGMAAALVEKGYAAVTIADVARHAKVSKRTFYEHFTDKQGCFLAAFDAASERLLQVVREAAGQGLIRGAVRAYLSALQAEPALTRTMLMEIQSAGPDALRLRRHSQRRFAALLVDGAVPISTAMATAVVGGINELVLDAVEQGRADRLTDLEATVVAFLEAVLR